MSAPDELSKCELCGEPMPPGETMFKFHGYSGDCPKPPLPKPDSAPNGLADELERAIGNLHVANERQIDSAESDVLNIIVQQGHVILAALRNQPGGAAPRGEPVAWIFQHDETGRTMILPANEADTWADLNPRWNRCSALYAATKAGEGETSATDERERG